MTNIARRTIELFVRFLCFSFVVVQVSKKSMTVTGFIFTIESVRTPKGNVFRLKINFTPEVIMLIKEVRIMCKQFDVSPKNSCTF
jgi:hypothetical protein